MAECDSAISHWDRQLIGLKVIIDKFNLSFLLLASELLKLVRVFDLIKQIIMGNGRVNDVSYFSRFSADVSDHAPHFNLLLTIT